MNLQALIISKKDNVATALTQMEKEDRIHLEIEDMVFDVVMAQVIPFGHKFALCHIDLGGAIIKYGEKIGTASGVIEKEDHVHLHNVEGFRGRGDKNEL
jgi:altronate dehydratase small subunit